MSFLQEKSLQSAKKGTNSTTRDANEGTKDHSLLVYSGLLRNEILGAQIEDFKELTNMQDDRVKNSGNPGTSPTSANQNFSPSNSERRNVFSFKARRQNIINEASSPYR